MGKGGTPQQEVTEYYMSEHFGICAAVDAVTRIIIKEKVAWEGERTSEGSIAIYNSELFGGVKKEGGVNGVAYFLPGGPTQVLPNGLAARFGLTSATCPGFRGIASLFFVGSHPDGGLWDGAGSSSIDVYKHNTYGGTHGHFTGPVANLEDYGLGDQISSIKTVGPWVVYEHDTYRGISAVVEGNLPDPFPNGHALHDKISSLAPLGYSPGASGSGGGFYWSANSPYLPGVWVSVRRAPIGLDPDLAMVPRYGAVTTFTAVQTVELDSLTNGSTSSAGGLSVGVEVTGLNPSHTIRVTLQGGEAWNDHNGDPGEWRSFFNVIPDGDAGAAFVVGPTTSYANEALAYAGFGTQYFTGASAYTFFIHDILVSDNTGAISILVESGSLAKPDANPAHIIYECLTNTDWGMGSPLAAIDYDSFAAASVTLYSEYFGLSLLWTRQSSIQDFVQEILDHIQAVLYVDPSTGLLTLTLIRADYDEATLPVIDPDNADLTSFSRKLWGDIVNEIVVTWTNPENEQEETITVQDDASIATQGGPVSDSRNYYGVRDAALAQSLAYRDLRSAGQPLATCEAEVDRTQWRLRPASVIKVTWPEYGLSEVVMRVTSIDYGKPGDMTIKLALIEDSYGLDIGSYDSPPTTAWEDPSAAAVPLDTVEIFTLPLFFAAHTTVAAFVDNPEYPEVLAGVLATTDSADTFSYELWDEVALTTGELQWQSLGTNNIIGRGELAADMDAEATSTGIEFEAFTGLTYPTAGGFAFIGSAGETGNEIVMITATGAGYTLTRGVLDTVPRAWPAGTPVWFVDGSTLFEDTLVRSSGEVVDYKLLPRTSQGLLTLGEAPLESQTLTDRPWLPNRPANVTAYGEAWSSEAALIDATARPDPWVTVSWANRNRLTEDSLVLAWTDATVTPEDGQTTTIDVLALDGTPLVTHDGLAGVTFDVPDASFGSEAVIRLRISAARTDADGDFVSLQYFEHWVQVAPLTFDSTRVTFDSDTWTMDEG